MPKRTLRHELARNLKPIKINEVTQIKHEHYKSKFLMLITMMRIVKLIIYQIKVIEHFMLIKKSLLNHSQGTVSLNKI